MQALLLSAVLSMGATLAPADARAEFAARLKKATGPKQLRELDTWSARNKLDPERAKVRAILRQVTPPARVSGDYRRREMARLRGEQARNEVEAFLEVRTKAVTENLHDVIVWMSDRSYAPPEARKRVLSIARRLMTNDKNELKKVVGALIRAKNKDRNAIELRSADRQFDAKLASVLREFTNKMLTAVSKCIAAGEIGYGFDLYRWLLEIDPENERAHRGLGEQKVEGEWLRPFEVIQWRRGFRWDPTFGWKPRQDKALERYDAGEIYDQTDNRWGKLAELNARHADAEHPWVIESEHFKLHSTATLEQSVKLVERLELFFLGAFRQYDRFFGSGSRAISLVFGTGTTKKLQVYFYRNRDQFMKHAKPSVEWAAGFYSGGRHASFFYQAGRHTINTMQHELTHQILGEFASGYGTHSPWVVEGAAVYLEYATARGGEVILDGIAGNREIAEYRKKLRAGEPEHTLRYLVKTFPTSGTWNQGVILRNYRGAGAAWEFLMNFDGGRYRGDTVQLLSDNYQGSMRSLSDYYGISLKGLTFLMKRYYTECDVR